MEQSAVGVDLLLVYKGGEVMSYDEELEKAKGMKEEDRLLDIEWCSARGKRMIELWRKEAVEKEEENRDANDV